MTKSELKAIIREVLKEELSRKSLKESLSIEDVKSVFFYTGVVDTELSIDELTPIMKTQLKIFLDESIPTHKRLNANVALTKAVFANDYDSIIGEVDYGADMPGTSYIIITDKQGNETQYSVDNDIITILNEANTKKGLREQTTAAQKVKVPCIHAWYEDDDGYIQNVGVYAGKASDEEIIDTLSRSGMMYPDVWDRYMGEIPAEAAAQCKIGNVIDIFDVDSEVIEAFCEENGLNAADYTDDAVFSRLF